MAGVDFKEAKSGILKVRDRLVRAERGRARPLAQRKFDCDFLDRGDRDPDLVAGVSNKRAGAWMKTARSADRPDRKLRVEQQIHFASPENSRAI